MGNMLINKRVTESLDQRNNDGGEMRIFPDHMYKGPLNLGDPNYRGLSKMEEDPLITQRLRDNARTSLCKPDADRFSKCAKNRGLMMWWHCRREKDEMVQCMEKWFYDKAFKEAVIEEYLNERSHFRQTGIKTKRYDKGTMVLRDEKNDPALDKDGNYRPRKPKGWDEAYAKTGPPKWANFKYD